MKLKNFKTLALMLSASAMLALSGCGSEGVSSNHNVVTPPPSGPAEGELGHQTPLADGTVDYVDYKGEKRNSVATVAESEYHTGKNFGNTLFDSADKKCQNCHNELYDTWKSSMHGQSWNDPIFQSKFQDFLRTHLAKIGQDNTGKGTAPNNGIVYEQANIINGTGVGTKNMFSGASQTCIKCHAPGAYYAGDVKVTVTDIGDATDINSSELTTLKATLEVNNPMGETVVIAANSQQNRLYKATFQIGHEANREGINCAFCHSIETPRLMKEDGMDMGTYTLKKDLRVGPHGPIKAAAGTDLNHNEDATDPDMNKFFRIWGPEKYAAYHETPKGGDDGTFDEGKSVDGRYTMTSKDINGTDGKVHYTGGPFYGPFGVSGKSNENSDDTTDRKALINPHFDKDLNNHFSESGKGLCLSCHQRSAGAAVPGGEEGAGHFMELCSTQMAVTTGDDVASGDTMSSPKCQKCHMERINGDLLHQFARPDLDFDAETFKAAVGYDLTPELDNEVSTSVIPEGEAPERDGWFNSHAFLGASKTGHKTSAPAKIKSGFNSTLATDVANDTLNVTTTLKNLTAHMFPGAHPMRRVLTRVIVSSDQGMVEVSSTTGNSIFTNIENTVQPLQGKVLHESALSPVSVNENGSANLSFPGKTADLNGTAISSQKFDRTLVTLTGTDSTIANQTISSGVTTGTNNNAAIVDSSDSSNFSRIYGHETGKKYNDVFVVRPGFDSNMVGGDTRLSPNETETYTLTYDISGKTGVKVEYRVYYMQKGANGKFPIGSDGFLKPASEMTTAEKKLLITEVAAHAETL